MSRDFNGLAAFVAHLAETEVALIPALSEGLERILVRVENEATAEIGNYQPAVGPFGAWAPLADSTEDEKARMGFPAGAPLLASGELLYSFEHRKTGLEGEVGTDDSTLIYLEFGTSKMPARPVLGPAAFKSKDFMLETVGSAAIAAFVGERVIRSVGYRFKV